MVCLSNEINQIAKKTTTLVLKQLWFTFNYNQQHDEDLIDDIEIWLCKIKYFHYLGWQDHITRSLLFSIF